MNPDCIVFDVDGVLLRSNETYREIIRLIVEGEWRRAGLMADAPGYSLELNTVFKTHGAFNDDYDIAWTLLNIAYSSGYDKLSQALPPPPRLAGIISSCAGPCAEWLPGHFEVRADAGAIHALGQDIFTGDDGGGGLWKMDSPMLDAHWSELPLPAYIYTGRDLREWRFAQGTLGWGDFPDERVIHSGTGIKKPSPEGLEAICSRFGHECPLFLGDTKSDKLAFDAFGLGCFAAVGDMPMECGARFPNVTAALSEILGWKS